VQLLRTLRESFEQNEVSSSHQVRTGRTNAPGLARLDIGYYPEIVGCGVPPMRRARGEYG
jgi:hypothetical protein